MPCAANEDSPPNLPNAAERARVGFRCIYEARDVVGRREVQDDECNLLLAVQLNARAYKPCRFDYKVALHSPKTKDFSTRHSA